MGYQLRFIEKYDIEAMARAVYSAGIHLADGRKEWLQLMMSMAGGGERLLDSFLLLASMSVKKYKERENRRLFLKAVSKGSDAGLKFFIDQCEKNGISPNDYLAPAALADSYRGRSAWRRNNNHTNNHQPQITNMQTTIVPIRTIDRQWVVKFGRGQDSTFHRSVVATGQLTAEELRAASELFRLGTTKDKRVVYWQIDAEGRVRDGKLMAYDEHCHRVKPDEHDTRSSVSWAGYEFRQCGLLDKDWEATHCLFGLHQLNSRPDAMVCIVEAEKTAVICSQKFKDSIWMAAGGLEQLNVDKLRPLVGRQVILYPDTDPEGEAYSKWREIAWQAKLSLGLDIVVSDVLEKNATPEQKEAKIDIADFIAEDNTEDITDNEAAPTAVEAATTSDETATTSVEAAPVINKKSQIQKIISNQAEIKKAKEKSSREMLREMAEDYPAINYLAEAFGAVPVDSS